MPLWSSHCSKETVNSRTLARLHDASAMVRGLPGRPAAMRARSASSGTVVRSRLVAQNAVLLLQLAAGVSLMIRRTRGLYLKAPVVLIALPSTLSNAWNIVLARKLRDE